MLKTTHFAALISFVSVTAALHLSDANSGEPAAITPTKDIAGNADAARGCSPKNVSAMLSRRAELNKEIASTDAVQKRDALAEKYRQNLNELGRCFDDLYPQAY